jgi:pimeloyl-ACP methyl ester carboxylesterase
LPAEAYTYPNNVMAAMTFLGALGLKQVDWLGTSMGGIVGMMIASNPAVSPIRKLVLNDVGPVFRREELIRIATYAGNGEIFGDLQEAESYFRNVFKEWGQMPDEEWAHVARHGTQLLPDGKYRLAYDDNIVAIAKKNIEAMLDMEIWALFEAVQIPMLVIHGQNSRLLTQDDVEQMKQRGKNVTAIDIPNVGHVPPLRSVEQIEMVEAWLGK